MQLLVHVVHNVIKIPFDLCLDGCETPPYRLPHSRRRAV